MQRGRLLRLALAVASLATTTAAAVSSASPATCPAPATCRAYVLEPFHWPVKSGHPVVIPYFVNTGGDPWLSDASFLGAVEAAARVWMRADPRVRLVYRGTTSALPGLVDGLNVVGFGPPLTPIEAGHAAIQESNGVITEADISIAVDNPFTWEPCAQRNGGCSSDVRPIASVPVAGENALTVRYDEIQGVIEHEFGHWLSLGHPPAPDGNSLTMSGTYGADGDQLHYQTLGLGDILGVRAAYPCGHGCGPPVVYTP